MTCQTLAVNGSVSKTIPVMELLRWPDVLTNDQQDISSLKEPLTELLKTAFKDIVISRQREGEQLTHFLKIKLQQVLAQVEIVKQNLPTCLQAQKEKLKKKLSELQNHMNHERLEQEMLLFTQRIDVEEEIDRLKAHVKEVNRVLGEKGAMGRRLDFLMQEMNREANTLGSKSADNIISQAAIELKVLIEQMREQIQNVE